MTKEDLEYLKQFENNFNTAINSDYTRNIVKSDLLKINEIYKRETGKTFNLCTHCKSSILSFLRIVGRVYFDIVQKGNELELKTSELEKTVANMENNKVKKIRKNAKHTTK